MLSLLISYAYMKPDVLRMVQATQGGVRWLLDSGAFTAHMQGREIDMAEYCEFLQENGHLFWQYIALDKVGDAEGTQANLDTMRAQGLNPMPVITVDEDVERAPVVLGASGACTHLCVAGGVSEPLELYGPRLAAVRRLVGADVWLHGLGFARGMKVASTQVNSVDASSWMAGQRWGQLVWFDPARGCRNLGWKDALRRKWNNLPQGVQLALVNMGLTSGDLSDKDLLQRGAVSMLGIQSAFASLQYAGALAQRGVRFIWPIPSVDLSMALIIAARHATSTGVPWAACRDDVARAREIQLSGGFADYVAAASDNARQLWSLT